MHDLLEGEIRTRGKRNVVQARSFAELLEQSLGRHQNRAIETAQVIEELIQLAKNMRAANARGETLGLRRTGRPSVPFWRPGAVNGERGTTRSRR